MCADSTGVAAVTVGVEDAAAPQDDDAALSPIFTTLGFGGTYLNQKAYWHRKM